MKKKLENKVVVVTGAAKGIGASIAKHMGDAGASVIVNYASDKIGAERVVTYINERGGEALAIQADMTKPEEIEQLFVEANKVYGKVDILVNNAGVFEVLPLEQITPDHFHRQFNLNVLGLIMATKEAVRYIGDDGGSIINISSEAAITAVPAMSVYSASKAAVNTITLSLSKELGAKKIRVNAISPGMVETEGSRTAGFQDTELQKQVVAETPLGRIGVPEDIALVAVFLASEDARWLSGQIIVAAGGHR